MSKRRIVPKGREKRVELEVSLNLRQAEAFAALRLPSTEADWLENDRDPQVIDVCFGGSKGPGKSFCLCVVGYAYALEVIRFFDLPVGEDVPHIGWIGRKVAQVFTGTTLETWKTVIPSECYKLVSGSEKHPRHIRIADRVALDYGGLDTRQDLERFNSAEYGIVLLDQTEETTRDDVGTLLASRRKRLQHQRLKRLISLPYRGLFTANPRQCWLKEDFIDRPKPGKIFVPALPRDNPRLPAGYIKTLEDAFGHRPDLLRAYRDGDWAGLGAVDQVILQEWITAARTRYRDPIDLKRLVSVDPARFGNDQTVLLGLENSRLIAGQSIPYSPTTQVSAAAAAMSTQLGDVPIVVEGVGLGGGVVDELRQMGRNVIEYNPSAGATNPDRYINLRAQVWDEVGKIFCTGVLDPSINGGVISLPEPDDPMLLQIYRQVVDQLTWPTYDFMGQKVKIATKEDIKAAHNGVSPDYGDAYAQGLWHLKYVEAVRYGVVGRIGAGYGYGYRSAPRNLGPMAG